MRELKQAKNFLLGARTGPKKERPRGLGVTRVSGYSQACSRGKCKFRSISVCLFLAPRLRPPTRDRETASPA